MAESEWGKLNAGQHYGVLALDIDRALACARMGEYEQVVMQYVREHCWGKATMGKGGRAKRWPESKRLKWSLPHVVAETGYPESRLCEAKRSLIDSRMLIKDGETLRPNKNAAEWVFPEGHSKAGQKRLSERALAYAVRAQNWRTPTIDEPDASTELDSATPESHSGTAERPFRHSGTAIPAQRNGITPQRNEIPAQRNGATKEERARVGEEEREIKDQTRTERRRGDSDQSREEDAPSIPAIPAAYEAICRKADAPALLCGAILRGAWMQDADIRATWATRPDHPAWTDALAPFVKARRKGEAEGDPVGPRYYLRIVERMIRQRPESRKVVRPEHSTVAPAYSPPPPGWRCKLSVAPKGEPPPPPAGKPSLESIRELMSKGMVRIA
jgi:hypothetical protein